MRLTAQHESVASSMPFRVVGQVLAVSGLSVEASGLALPLGSLCRIDSFGEKTSLAEVIGFQQDRTVLMPLSNPAGVARGDRVENVQSAPRAWCSPQLLGRVIDAMGRPIDGRGPLRGGESRRLDAAAVAPMQRKNIREPITTGVRAIDALHTCGRGQRMGIFSGPGVGKSTLLASIARNSDADVCVVALIGERGREVQEFLHSALGEKGLQRCVVVVSTSDEAPPLRVRAGRLAATVAEYFRDQGRNVLLLLDSITRLCHAQRQIGLAAHEPPATKGYPPSVFALLPQILERAGKTEHGSITGFYTVLVEADDFNEPIPDAVKGTTDGHLWLSRALANRGHFPPIDMLQSISRVRGDVCPPDQLQAARKVTALLSVYHQIEDMVNIGAYVAGTNPQFDLAVQAAPRIFQFLQQDSNSTCTIEQSRSQLDELVAWIDQTERSIAVKR